MSHTFRRVIVGVDGSLGSLQALRVAAGHARAFGAVLVPVLAWTPPHPDLPSHRFPAPSLVKQWRRNAEQRLRTAFDDGLGGIPDDLDVSALVLHGLAGYLLVAVADQDEDLLVVGTGRRGVFHRVIRGSVSRQCMAAARCPVIVVPTGTAVAEPERSRATAHGTMPVAWTR